MARSMKTTGEELKKLVKMGMKRPMPFGFCPSAGDDDNVLIIHPTKEPEFLGKVARKESEGTKIAYGTFTLTGKTLMVTCQRELSGLAYSLKRHLILERLPLMIEILDLEGNVLEANIEPVGEDTGLEDVDDIDDDDLTGDDEIGAAIDAAALEDDPILDPAALAARLAAVKSGVDGSGPGAQAKLSAVMAAAIAAIKAGALSRADTAIAAIEAALDRAQAASGTADPAAMIARISATKDQFSALTEERRAQITPLLNKAALAVKDADLATAGTIMDAVETAIAAELNDASDAAKWHETAAKLEVAVAATLKADRGDTSAIAAAWASARTKAEAGDFAAALAIAPHLTSLMTSARDGAEPDPATTGDALARSRRIWGDARRRLHAEIEKLKPAPPAASSGTPIDHINAFDDGLEQTLKAVANTPDGPAREALKARAKQIISAYQGEIGSDFFADIDGPEGNLDLAVRSTAVAALNEVTKALT